MKTFTLLAGMLFFQFAVAQQTESLYVMRTDPYSVILENYVVVTICHEPIKNEFDRKNPYTYLLLIHDKVGNPIHLLYQTDFTENLSFVAVSSNINRQELLNRKIEICSCMKKLGYETFDSVRTSGMLRCLTESLLKCTD